ncbi:LysM peptidoglycan-binding domain-containing protein [Gracilibacillus caseinilyticus]|uniref:LysM peptidoglycan-binding domain-containing protein n=1 Tax=Gracilibacillus caseinilyticus TaxID=2932256 RepID=A0ABY4EUR9_9BACI|nr:LysM peptidoglycan-binding domain-containing protein [Gracilibacillus caseinilyticus]UOQ47552.1 LysM peptidoglycan-binding domain-containing protein [Gracilibacillus caseinilyticus]
MRDDNMNEDQAASLRDQIERQQGQENDALPPRSEVHKNKKQKSKWKISFPLIRFMLILFIAIIVLIWTMRYWGEEYLSKAVQEKSDHSVEEVTIKSKSSTVEQLHQEVDLVTHVVRKMDSLFSISEQYYGTSEYVDIIIEANDIENRTLIVGQEITIPNINADSISSSLTD